MALQKANRWNEVTLHFHYYESRDNVKYIRSDFHFLYKLSGANALYGFSVSMFSCSINYYYYYSARNRFSVLQYVSVSARFSPFVIMCWIYTFSDLHESCRLGRKPLDAKYTSVD